MKVKEECHSCKKNANLWDGVCKKCGRYSCYGLVRGRCWLGCKFEGDCEAEYERWDKIIEENEIKFQAGLTDQTEDDVERALRDANS